MTRYDVATGAVTGQWQVGKMIAGMSVSPDGQYLWTGDLEPVSQTYDSDGIGTTVSALHRLDLRTGVVDDFERTSVGRYSDAAFFDVGVLSGRLGARSSDDLVRSHPCADRANEYQ